MNTLNTERKNFDILDLTKFILAYFVVAIHGEILPKILYPWLRIAVPMFFVISSFLFFNNINGKKDAVKNTALKKFVKRNLTLYAVWFVLLLPFTFLERKAWFDEGIALGVFRFFRGLLFGSTFRASWFIMANVLAVIIIFILSKKIKNGFLFTGALILYLLCCLVTCYKYALEGTALNYFYIFSKVVFDGIATSFVQAFIWVVIGKMFAENKIVFSRKCSHIGLVISCVVLYAEFYLSVEYMQADFLSSCYITLIPLCIFLFSTLLKIQNIQVKNARVMRNLSTFIYVTHCAALTCFAVLFKSILKMNYPVAIFIFASVSVSFVGLILIVLSEKEKFKFLKKLW